MIRMLTAFTEEIDDVEVAVSDILGVLDMENCLLANSVGIMHCSSDFTESDVVGAICGRLPFSVVGATTLAAQVPGASSRLGLTLVVLTSGDVKFATGVSAPVEDDMSVPVTDLYGRLTAGLPERPAMLMPFIPFMLNVGGDEFIDKIDELSGGLPAFGTVAISAETDFSNTAVIFDGKFYPASLALIALIGEVNPVFMSVSVDEKNILKQKAVITEMNRNVIERVNDTPALQYLESMGLATNGDVSGLVSMPFVIMLEDGSRLIRACVGATETGGVILCGGAPLNSVLALATLSSEDVVRSTREKVSEALAQAGGRGVLMYSCAARNWALGTKFMAEQEVVDGCIGDSAPYHFVYSGGEIFPAFFADGSVSNQLQNDTMILCIL
ncbi:MAG: FIST C-terminal domain-containing protein [Synergistaceae bacterium]|jgi:hypothetical protein|nr:FIST C-terminal domain-containing protein [Synergistaceae bacterium]